MSNETVLYESDLAASGENISQSTSSTKKRCKRTKKEEKELFEQVLFHYKNNMPITAIALSLGVGESLVHKFIFLHLESTGSNVVKADFDVVSSGKNIRSLFSREDIPQYVKITKENDKICIQPFNVEDLE